MTQTPTVSLPAVPADDPLWIEAGRRFFAGECQFFREVPTFEFLPEVGPPEVAFAGRSNVGKSSLINALTGRHDLARASNTPGRTQALIFFSMSERLWLVDMPGYGHAEASKTEIARWNRLIDDYLRGRVSLRRLCLLVDARHGLKPSDLELMTRLDRAAVVYQVVLTKADKLKTGELAKVLEKTKLALVRRVAAHPLVIASSAETGLGMAELRAELVALAHPAEG